MTPAAPLAILATPISPGSEILKMTPTEALYIDVSVLRLAVAQIIADNCHKDENPDAALRMFAERLYKRIDNSLRPDNLQDVIALMSAAVDNLVRTVQAARKID
jgi:signal transduction histidine kinase